MFLLKYFIYNELNIKLVFNYLSLLISLPIKNNLLLLLPDRDLLEPEHNRLQLLDLELLDLHEQLDLHELLDLHEQLDLHELLELLLDLQELLERDLS